MKNIADYVLLYQKDKDSRDFPFVEAKRAVRCFERKPVFARLRPSCVIINPADDQPGLEGRLQKLALELRRDPRVGRGYLWLSGKMYNGKKPQENPGNYGSVVIPDS